MRGMKRVLPVAVLAVLALAAGAHGTSVQPRVWLATPTTVAGSGFPAGKVRVTVQTQSATAKQVARAARSGRFSVRFGSPIRYDACHAALVTAVGAGGARATKRLGGRSRDCAPPVDSP